MIKAKSLLISFYQIRSLRYSNGNHGIKKQIYAFILNNDFDIFFFFFLMKTFRIHNPSGLLPWI